MDYHVPVLLEKSLEGLALKPGGTYVDATFGGGGHSRAILARLGAGGRLLAFDQDEDVLPHVPDDARFTFVRSNFKYLKNFLRYHGIESLDGILADLGVSSHHFDDAARGFSFRFDGALDMRMNRRSSLTAARVLNSYTAARLTEVLRLYGEVKNARRMVDAVLRRREREPFSDMASFVETIYPLCDKGKEKKDLARVFQALRMEVNGELDALRSLLQQSVEVLKPGGRMVVIAYHSLEDRMVKNFIRSGKVDGPVEKDFYGNVLAPLRAVNSRVVVPDDEEVARNPRARSAKLRVAEKTG